MRCSDTECWSATCDNRARTYCDRTPLHAPTAIEHLRLHFMINRTGVVYIYIYIFLFWKEQYQQSTGKTLVSKRVPISAHTWIVSNDCQDDVAMHRYRNCVFLWRFCDWCQLGELQIKIILDVSISNAKCGHSFHCVDSLLWWSCMWLAEIKPKANIKRTEPKRERFLGSRSLNMRRRPHTHVPHTSRRILYEY